MIIIIIDTNSIINKEDTVKFSKLFNYFLFLCYTLVPILIAVYVFRQVSGVLSILDASLDQSETLRVNNRRMQEDLKQAISVQALAQDDSYLVVPQAAGNMYASSVYDKAYEETKGDKA